MNLAKSFSLFSLCFALAFALGNPVRATEFEKLSTQKLLDAAEFEYKHKRCEKAMSLAEELLRRDPASERAYWIKAGSLDYLVGPAEAIKFLEPAIKKYPRNFLLLVDIAEYYNSAGQFNKAIDVLTTAIKMQPSKYEYYHMRSIAYSSQKRYREAADDMTAYLKLHPAHARGYQWRADAYKQLGQFDKAIADLGQAIELGKKQAGEYRLQRADLYMDLKEYKKALADYDVVLKESAMDDTVWFKKGQVLVLLKDYNNALKAFTEAIELSDSSTAYYARSDVYEKLKDHAAALKDRAMGDKLAKQRAIERI